MKHEMIALARQLKDDGPVIRDCYLVSQVILSGLREATKYAENPKFNLDKTPIFLAQLSAFPGAAPYVKRYGDLRVRVTQGESTETGYYTSRSRGLVLHYKRGSVGPESSNLKAVLTSDPGTLQHELRHWIDDVTDLEKHKALSAPKQSETYGFAAYYSQEHEVDARLADLLIRVDTGFMGAAIKVLRGEADADTPMFYEALKSASNFQKFVLRVDKAFSRKFIQVTPALQQNLLTPEAWVDALDKVGEFYKLMYDDYGMAFRITPKQDATPRRVAAWKSLKEIAANKKTVTQHMEETRERELTPNLVKIIGPEAKPAARSDARERLAKMSKLQKATGLKTPATKSKKGN